MNFKLKEAIDEAYRMCDALEKTNIWTVKTVSAREKFKDELLAFLINLSFVDGKITVNETNFIKEYLNSDFSTNEIREYAVANKIYKSSFSKNVPYCFKCFVKADNEIDSVNETATLILNLYKELGNEFAKCDSYNKSENYMLNSFCENLQNYIDEQFINKANNSFKKISDKSIEQEPVKESDEKIVQKEETLDELLEELNSLVGLEKVKSDVQSLINLVKIRKVREERGLKSPTLSLHMVFSGNPGTGKTTIARLLSKIYKSMGLLSKGHLTEVDRSGLVGGYVGQTALKVQDVIKKAKGGVLFIDEAYSLTVNRSSTDYGFEAVDTLLKYMEDIRDDLIVIVAGYPEPMEEFLNSNPGLKSRFNKYLYFEDYTVEELMGILNLRAKKSNFKLSKEAEKFSFEFFKNRCENKPENYANARDVRNFFEKAIVNQANRLAVLNNITDEQLATIELNDVNTIIM